MYNEDQRKVAKAIVGAFLASCLAGGAMVTAAQADTMMNSPAAKNQSNATAGGGMMRHGCSGKSHTQKKKDSMMGHGCSSKTQTQKSGM